MSTYLIELPENDEMTDLVGRMAGYTKAEYRIVATLETDDERLARAVTALTGQILTLEECKEQPVAMAEQPINSFADFVHSLDDQHVRLNFSMILPVQSEQLTEAEQVEESHLTAGEKCEICGEPAGPRGKTCGKEACRKESKKRYMAGYLAEKGKKAAAAPIVPTSTPTGGPGGEVEPSKPQEEAPAAEPPLAEESPVGTNSETVFSPVMWPVMTEFRVMSGPLVGTFMAPWEVLEKAKNGDLEMGTFLLHKDGRKARLARNGYATLIRFGTEQPEPALPGAE